MVRINRTGLAVFLMAALCVCFLSPSVRRFIGDTAIMCIAAVYLLLMLTPLLNCERRERNTILLILLYLAILFLNKLLGRSTASVSQHMTVTEYFLCYILILPVYKQLSRKQIIFLLIVILGTMTVTMVQNYQLKLLWGYRYSIQLYKTSGVRAIIDTQYTGAILFASGALFCAFLQAGGAVRRRLLFLALTVFFVAFNLIVTQRGIILVLSIALYPLLILFNRDVRSKGYTLLLLVLAALLVFVAFEYETVLTWIGEITGSARLARRLDSITALIGAGGAEGLSGGSLAARLRLTGGSIDTFWSSASNMLFGVGLRLDSNELVGNHSQFFDEFARFGVFGGLLSLVLMLRMLKSGAAISGVSHKTTWARQLAVIMMIAFVRSLVGTIMDEAIGVCLYIMIPLLFRLLQKEERGASE